MNQLTLEQLAHRVGTDLGTSAWHRIGQDTISAFGQLTHDEQWIHVDPQRAATGPFAHTVAHGFLTLSLATYLLTQITPIADTTMINYGLNRVRFPAPVPAGASIRGSEMLKAFAPLKDGGAHTTIVLTIEMLGQPKPACVAECIMRFI